MRRGFVKALDAGGDRTAVGVELFARLYDVERLASEREDGPEERQALRDEYARSVFVESDGGGERAAVIYSILACCNLAGVEPFAYMRDVPDRLSRGWPASRPSELLPENRRSARATSAEATGGTAAEDGSTAAA